MASLPAVTAGRAMGAFMKAGFTLARTTGSHHILKKPGHRLLLSIPVHAGQTLGRGLLKSQITAAGLTVDEFVALL